jgi:tetratricopeptide (TPR) repeat protein
VKRRYRSGTFCTRAAAAVAGFAVIYALGCLSPSTQRSRRAAERHLADGDYLQAAVAYEKVALSSRGGTRKTRALLSAAQARLRAGDAEGAVSLLRQTKRENLDPELEGRIELQLGQASLAARRWNLAQRHLEQGLRSANKAETEVTLARIAYCHQQLAQPGRARSFQARLKSPRSGEVQAILAGRDPLLDSPSRAAGFSAKDREWSASSTARVDPLQRPGASQGQGLRVEARHVWRARQPVHHSASDDKGSTARREVATVVYNMQKYHQREKGWADIGYHYLIDRVGRIWQGRDVRFQGAHAGGVSNRGNIGIAVLGNYSRRRLNSAQWHALESLIERLCSYYHIPSSQIYTHREIQRKTECPGHELQRCVQSIRTSLATARRRRDGANTLGD